LIGRGPRRGDLRRMAGMDDGGHSGFGQGRGGNDGMSGAPMWQIKRKMAQYDAQRENLIQELIRENEEKRRPAEAPNVLVDAVASGLDGKTKPLVRHVLVKDLNRVAQMKSIEFPFTDLFQGKAPIGMYALFDGQSCSGMPGPAAAEYCARNLHTKVMDNLVMLKQGSGTEPFIKAAIIKSFHDLDADYLALRPEAQDGCGAAVALLIGGHLFVATLGRCTAVLAEAPEDGGRPRPHTLVGGGQPQATAVAGSLGEPARKSAAGGAATLSCTPEVHGVALKSFSQHPFLILGSSTMAAVLDTTKLVDFAADFSHQPRIACGELLVKGSEAHAAAADKPPVPPQLVVAQVSFMPPKEKAPEKGSSSEPAAKKAKPGMTKDGMRSVRMRHILLRTQDSPQLKQLNPTARAKAKPRAQAEALLRDVLKELSKDLKAAKKVPKTPNDLVVYQGKKFAELCREMSDCPTSKKGGAMCGDLGWMASDLMLKMGANFKENVDALTPGQWSDITQSKEGLHFIQKIA